MIEAFYEIPNKSINKRKTWYSVKDNILYVKGIKANYFIELIKRSNKGTEYCIGFSNMVIHNNCKRCHFDNYGRLKIKPKLINKYLNDVLDKDSNVNLIVDNEFNEGDFPCIVYKVSVN